MARFFSKRHPKVGARPGTLSIPKEAPPPRLHLIQYSPNEVAESDLETIDELAETFSDSSVTWIDVQGFGDRKMIRQLAERFSLHRLLLEDLVNAPQRPKAEDYDDQLLVIVRMVRLDGFSDDNRHQIDLEQVSVVIGKNYVLTFQERYGDVLDPVRRRIRDGKGIITTQGSDYLAYAIIDTIVDSYYPALEKIGDHLERMEDEVVQHPTPELLAELNRLKNQLVNLRRGVWPHRELLMSIVRGEFPHVTDDVRLYFRDTYDHALQTTEVIEMYRELVTSLVNTYLSSVANRTNEVMKVLTIVATIFIPLTFIAGIYGMNFEYMPELKVRWAYPAAWAAMLGISGTMIGYFWAKGWIGPGRK